MSVDVTSRRPGKQASRRRIKKQAEKILRFLNQEQAELSIALVGNREIRELNARYRDKDQPTDVLSFSCEGPLEGDQQLLGDVVISLETAAQQAKERGKTLEEEIEDLLIHGILHLLGYDHERSPEEARVMRRLERRVRRQLDEEDS
ncbi:MAG: rRNA maturation RNase YbeY [Deltaproteobacteria bacterium]|nr:rRNA maturation RNase YbeY [Deltaproteobacteria bacterium]